MVKKASLYSSAAIAALLTIFASAVFGQEFGPSGQTSSKRNSEIALGPGYFAGAHRMFLRDGNNNLITPEKREIGSQSPLLQATGQTRRSGDWLLRLQAWTNVPQTYRHDWWIYDKQERRYVAQAWDTKALTAGADIAGGYLLGLGGFPYSAAPVVGYRYMTLRYDSTRVADSRENYYDRIQVHLPYIGVYYDNSDFVNSVVKLDLRTSVLTLAQINSSGSRALMPALAGNSVFGFWFEAMFSWNIWISERASMGLFAEYSYLEFTASVTASEGNSRTSFYLDSRSHAGSAGIVLSYLF